MSGNNPSVQEPDATVDLDQFLKIKTEPDESAAEATVDESVQMPDADRMVVVGIFVDDSGSMEHLTQAVKDGLKLSVEAFRGAKGSDFYLYVQGFKGGYFKGLLKDVEENTFDRYYPNYGSTPLITHTSSHLTELRTVAEKYRAMGIPTTVAMLIITDGYPNDEEAVPANFKERVRQGDYIVGMGVAERGDDEGASRYSELFKAMGVSKSVTPKSAPPEVRHAINQFSQSVASIASS